MLWTRPIRDSNGKVSAFLWGLHPISLPRAANDSLQARISGGRMTESGRLKPVPDTTASTDSSRPRGATFRDEAPATEHDKDEKNDVHPRHM